MRPSELAAFVKMSNGIEGILGNPTFTELTAHDEFMKLETVHIPDLERFVTAIQPGARLRLAKEDTVTVGAHIPPAPGQAVLYNLQNMLDALASNPYKPTPYKLHCAYLTLHPFTDGNGRSARALYAWQSNKLEYTGYLERGFLKQFYFDALGDSDGRLNTGS